MRVQPNEDWFLHTDRSVRVDKDKIYDMIETIEAHLGSMLNTEQDGMPSKAFRESEKKGGSLKSMGRIAELYD